MAGLHFLCGDMGPAMEAKGTVTNEILEMIEEDPRVCYINADGTGSGGRVRQMSQKYPDRVVDVGIQEMNMVTMVRRTCKTGIYSLCADLRSIPLRSRSGSDSQRCRL